MAPQRPLAVFDIDGTLTDTNAVDDEYFLRAVGEVLGLASAALPATLDWSAAPHVTDSALLRWLCEAHCGRSPHAAEADAALSRFLNLLRGELAAAPARFGPIVGATRVLPELRAAGWEVALATGGWEPSARLKLSAAGVDHAGVALASGSDALTRVEILELAVRRASRVRGEAFARVVSVGDRRSDVRAALLAAPVPSRTTA